MPFDNPTQTVVKTELDICDEMLELLATPDRWCQRVMQRGKALCMYGALNMADRGHLRRVSTPSGFLNDAAAAVHNRINRLEPRGGVFFNDCPGTTHADVLAFIRRVRASFVNAKRKNNHAV